MPIPVIPSLISSSKRLFILPHSPIAIIPSLISSSKILVFILLNSPAQSQYRLFFPQRLKLVLSSLSTSHAMHPTCQFCRRTWTNEGEACFVCTRCQSAQHASCEGKEKDKDRKLCSNCVKTKPRIPCLSSWIKNLSMANFIDPCDTWFFCTKHHISFCTCGFCGQCNPQAGNLGHGMTPYRGSTVQVKRNERGMLIVDPDTMKDFFEHIDICPDSQGWVLLHPSTSSKPSLAEQGVPRWNVWQCRQCQNEFKGHHGYCCVSCQHSAEISHKNRRSAIGLNEDAYYSIEVDECLRSLGSEQFPSIYHEKDRFCIPCGVLYRSSLNPITHDHHAPSFVIKIIDGMPVMLLQGKEIWHEEFYLVQGQPEVIDDIEYIAIPLTTAPGYGAA